MKVAIIGAGICGLYLAKNLAQRGNEVVVFEKRDRLGKACCSGLFSARLFDRIPEARALIQNRINRCVIHFPIKDIILTFKQPFFVLDHAVLDLLVAGLATRAGASIKFNEKIDAARLADLQKHVDRIIGCDGALSATRHFCRSLTPARLRRSDFCRLGIQGFEDKTSDEDFVETWATKDGFLWRIPRKNNVEWGIMENPKTARRLFDEFINSKKIELGDLKSAIIPQDFWIPDNEKITLCGDASGLTKPWSGGGVIWNLTQADILLKNFPNFIEYKNAARSYFAPRIFIGKTAKQLAYWMGFNFPAILPAKFRIDSDYLFKL